MYAGQCSVETLSSTSFSDSVRRFEDLIGPYRINTAQKDGHVTAEQLNQDCPWMVSDEEIETNKPKVTIIWVSLVRTTLLPNV